MCVYVCVCVVGGGLDCGCIDCACWRDVGDGIAGRVQGCAHRQDPHPVRPTHRRAPGTLPVFQTSESFGRARSHDRDAQLHYLSLPSALTHSHVLLMDATIATGAAALMALRVLLDHGVPAERIMLLALIAAPQGMPRRSAHPFWVPPPINAGGWPCSASQACGRWRTRSRGSRWWCPRSTLALTPNTILCLASVRCAGGTGRVHPLTADDRPPPTRQLWGPLLRNVSVRMWV
jgi:hypothetical protein